MRASCWMPLVVTVTLFAAACGGGSEDSGAGEGTGGAGGASAQVDPADCGIEVLAGAEKPVEVVFWHQLLSTAADTLDEQVDRFNTMQHDVHVTAVSQPPDEILTQYRAGLETGTLPALLDIDQSALQAVVDSRSTVPMQACVDATGFSLDEFIPRTIAYYMLDGVLLSMPYDVSTSALHYDRHMFTAAGLDPDDPPETLAEVREYSQRIVDAGVASHGVALNNWPYINESWFAMNDELYTDHGNGRDGRATAANFDNETGLALWGWRQDMLDDGLAVDTGRTFTADDILAIVAGKAAMAFGLGSLIGPIHSIVAGGQYGGETGKSGVAPLPGLAAGGGALPIGGSLYLVEGPPEQVAAAWKFVEYLTDTDQLVELHLEAGYVPVRQSAVDDPRVQQFWEEWPEFRVSYDMLTTGPETDATAGAVIGDFQGVRDAVERSWEAMQAGKLTPEEAVAQAQRDADTAIRVYNERLGL